MATTVLVNKLSVVHKKSNGLSMAFPDVCKTPAPPSPPIPIPYPNVAKSSDSADAASTVLADGNPLMHKGSNFSTSTGDEAGSLNGIMSNKIKGKAYPKMYSFDVKVEGQNVFRFTDIMLQNGGSPTNTPPAAEMQATAVPALAPAPPEEPKVTRFKWSRPHAVCGDKVKLSVKTKNVPADTNLPVTVVRAQDMRTPLALLSVPVSGNAANFEWIVYRGSYKKDTSAKAMQTWWDGKESTLPSLEIKTAVGAKERVSNVRVAPQYTLQTVGGVTSYQPSGANFLPWTGTYDIEIKDGELVVLRKIDFILRGGVRLTAKKKRAWKREIEAIWNRKFKIHRNQCKRGTRCTCSSTSGCCAWTVRIVAEFGPGQPGEPTELWKGPNSLPWGGPRWWYVNKWWEGLVGVSATVRAHEFGHQIGLFDEYPGGACHPSRTHADVPASIMSSGSRVYPRHVQEFHEWFDRKARGVVGRTTLVRL